MASDKELNQLLSEVELETKKKVLLEEINDLKKKEAEANNDLIKQQEIAIESIQKEIQLAKIKQIEILKNDKADNQQKELAKRTLIDLNLHEERRIKAAKKVLEETKKVAKENKDLLKTYGGIVTAEEKRGSSLKANVELSKKLYDLASKMSKEDLLATFTSRLAELGIAFITRTIQTTQQFDSLAASMRKATNTSGELDSAIIDITRSNVSFGMSMEDSQRAIIAMREGFADMSNMTISAQQDMGNFAAVMEKAGIESNTTARFLNNVTKNMGVSAGQAKKFEKDIFMFGKANGIATKTLADGLNSVMPRLAAFGKDGIKVFKELAFQAKNMGMEMGEVLNITEKLTTYESAAEFAGQMNAILGRNAFDTIEVLRQASDDPMKLIENMRTQLNASGKSFDQLGGQMKRAIATAAGMSVSELGSMMKKTSAEMKQAAASEEAFNNAVEKFIPIGDKLKALVAALTPAIEWLAKGVNAILDVLTEFAQSSFGQVFLQVTGTILGLYGAFKTLTFFLPFVSTGFGMLKALFTTAGASATVAAAQTGAAAGEMAAASTTAATGASTAVGGFIRTVSAAAVASAEAVPLLLGIALAFTLIGAGVYLAAKGIAVIFKALTEGNEHVWETIAAFGVFSLMLVGLGVALGKFALIGIAGIAVLGLFALEAYSLGKSFLMIGEGFAKTEQGLASLERISNSLEKFTLIKDVFVLMSAELDKMAKSSDSIVKLLDNPLLDTLTSNLQVNATPVAAVQAGTLTKTVYMPTSSKEAEGSTKEIRIVIDSPIMLDNTKMGQFVTDRSILLRDGKITDLNPQGVTSESSATRAAGKLTRQI